MSGPGPALSHDCGDVRDPQVAQLLRGGVELLLHHGPFGLLDALRGVRRHLEGRTAAPEDVGDRVEHVDDDGLGLGHVGDEGDRLGRERRPVERQQGPLEHREGSVRSQGTPASASLIHGTVRGR